MSKYKQQIYSEWYDAREDVWFVTRSPYPTTDYYLSPEKLPKCSNEPSFLYSRFTMDDVEAYFLKQVAVLRYNNPEFTPHQVLSVVTGRIMYWRGNNMLRKDPYIIKRVLPGAIEKVFSMANITGLIEFTYTRHWYSNEIEKMSGHRNGESWGDKMKAKQAARSKVMASAKEDDIKTASSEYRRDMYNVLPTPGYLSDITTYSVPTVKKYGEGLYISKKENTRSRVVIYRSMYPELTQVELVELLEISLRTVKLYWNELHD